MAVKAQLSVQLLAGSVLVAESDDPQLWQNILAAIQAGNARIAGVSEDAPHLVASSDGRGSHDGPVGAFADALDVSEEELTGACGPDLQAPYIHLDQRYWEALRIKTGSRGLDAIAPVALAATLLAMWFKHAEIAGSPTIQQCQAVLATIGLRDQNVARSLRNTEWLQSRQGGVQINPAQWSLAVRVARAYCLRKSPKELLTTASE